MPPTEVEGGVRAWACNSAARRHLPRAECRFWSLSEAEAIRATQRLGARGPRKSQKRNGFTTKMISPVGERIRYLPRPVGPHGRTDVWHEALVTHQEGEALGLRRLGIGGAVDSEGSGRVC